VDVAPPPAVSAQASAICTRLLAALPTSLQSGVVSRPVAGDAQRTAAWGDPAVSLACGTPAPVDDPRATLVQVGPGSGGVVTFVVEDVEGGTAFTTSGLPVPVTVTVPDAYDSTLLVPLTGPLLEIDRA
jgi:hypothetical protein